MLDRRQLLIAAAAGTALPAAIARAAGINAYVRTGSRLCKNGEAA